MPVSLTVQLPLSAPTNLRATPSGRRTISVSWNAVPGAIDYRLVQGIGTCIGSKEGEEIEVSLHRIDVALDTPGDSYLELLDDDGWDLAYNHDFGDPRASRIVWEARESGGLYVEVGDGGDSDTGTGSYTLTITRVGSWASTAMM